MVIIMNNKLSNLREDNDYSQKDIATMQGIARPTYSKWEINEKIPPLPHINTLANIYDSSIDYLLGLKNINKPTTRIEKLNYMQIGHRITEIRKDNNLSMRELAKQLNTSHSTISSYEHKKHLILTSFAYQISKKYNISLDWLCGRSNNKYMK